MRNENLTDYDLAVCLARGRQLRSAAVLESFKWIARQFKRLAGGARAPHPTACPAE
ncbi:MAG: hypothetical protein WD969_06955 [Paracoccaceae bacterium]